MAQRSDDGRLGRSGRDRHRSPRQPACRRGRARLAPCRADGLREQLIGWAFALPFVAGLHDLPRRPDRWRRWCCRSPTSACATCATRSAPTSSGWTTIRRCSPTRSSTRRSINTAYFVIVGVPLTLVLGLGRALALDRGIRRFRTLFRVGYYLPVVTSIVAIAVVWRFVLNPDQGLVNLLLAQVGIDGPSWLGRPDARHAVDHRDGRLAQPRLRDDRVPGRPPDDPGRSSTRRPRSTAPGAGRRSAT